MGKRKTREVAKFGGVDELGKVKVHGSDHDVRSIEAQSNIKLEEDTGYGEAVIVRNFRFAINPEAFKQHPPSKQDLFNYHLKFIETALWRDGLKVFSDVEPRITMDSKKMQYTIIVAARPMKGQMLLENPNTLTQLVHGR